MSRRSRLAHRAGASLRRPVVLAAALAATVLTMPLQAQETEPAAHGELVTAAGIGEQRREPLDPALLTAAAVLMIGAAAFGLRITLRGWRDEERRRRRRHRHRRAGSA